MFNQREASNRALAAKRTNRDFDSCSQTFMVVVAGHMSHRMMSRLFGSKHRSFSGLLLPSGESTRVQDEHVGRQLSDGDCLINWGSVTPFGVPFPASKPKNNILHQVRQCNQQELANGLGKRENLEVPVLSTSNIIQAKQHDLMLHGRVLVLRLAMSTLYPRLGTYIYRIHTLSRC